MDMNSSMMFDEGFMNVIVSQIVLASGLDEEFFCACDIGMLEQHLATDRGRHT